MNFFMRRLLKTSTCFCLFMICAWMPLLGHTQSKEQLHAQSPDSSENYVHARGKTQQDKGLLERYAPPPSLSSDSYKFDGLFNYTTWAAIIYMLILVAALGFFVWRYRERPGHTKAFYTHGLKEKKVTLIFDLIFFITLDCVLIYKSVVHTKEFMMNPPQGPDVVRVQVMPQQWAWNFRYPGTDKTFGTADDIVTLNELWVPQGKMLSLQIKSKDVIHGFMVQGTRRQMDAIPGSITRLWFDVQQEGDFEIACMHLCGTAHYKMKAFMKVVKPDDYKLWHSEMSEWSEAKYDPVDKATHWGWDWGI